MKGYRTVRRVSILVVALEWLAIGSLGEISASLAAEPRVLLQTATERAETWRYTTEEPGADWASPTRDCRAWAEGKAGFGVADAVTPAATIGTPWTTERIWLRKTIQVDPPADFQVAALGVRHDEDVEVYLNGRLIFTEQGYNTRMTAYDVTKELRAALRPGENLVAVCVKQTVGGQYIDLGLVLDPKEKPLPARMDPAELKKLRDARWPAAKAWQWYAGVGPVCGANYLPRTAVNTTEMWQRESFDAKTIDEELGWAEKSGLNGLRVFVQYVVYEADPQGLIERMEEFLKIAKRHHLRVMFVLLDDCFLPEPNVGPQPDPVPGVHNSQWTSSPGQRRKARDQWPALEKYVKDVVGHFARDERVLVWDLYNEAKPESRPLVEAAFAWARAANPGQPLTACWHADDLWDVASFHDYGPPNAKQLARWTSERPALCTECIARGAGSRFDNVLPAFAEHGIGWYMWGLVKGRTQTYYPWNSPRGAAEPNPWHHDLLQPDGTPHRAEEPEAIRRFPSQFRVPKACSSGGDPAQAAIRPGRDPAMKYGDPDRTGRPFAKDPSVIRFHDRYLMYYSVAPYDKKLAPPGAPRGWAIGIAESRDLVQWKKAGEILPEQPCEQNGIVNGRIILLDGKLHLFYNTYGNGAKDALCHATSADGLRFARNPTNPIWNPSGDWNNGRAIDCDVVEWGDKLLLYYATRDPTGTVQMLHAVAADRRSGFGRPDWRPLADGPVLKPELPWETRCIEAPSLINRGEDLYLFYGGGYNNDPQQIGCAVSRDGVRFQRLFTERPLLANGGPGEWNASESGHPGLFVDDDGQMYLFYQGNNDRGRTWFLSRIKLGWKDDRPYVLSEK